MTKVVLPRDTMVVSSMLVLIDNGNKGRSVFGSVVKSHLVQENKQKVSALIKTLSTNRDCFTYCYRAYDVQHICYS